MDSSIALLDWDNSLRDGWVIADWADRLSADRLFPSANSSQLRALLAQYDARLVSYETLADAIPQVFAAGLTGLSVQQISGHAKQFVSHDAVGPRPFVEELLSALDIRGIAIAFVSGAPQEILDALLARYNGVAAFGTIFEEVNGIYTGAVNTNGASEQTKATVVSSLRGQGWHVVVAVGDSNADRPILRAADWPVVVGNDELAADVDGSISLSSDAGDIGSLLRRLDS